MILQIVACAAAMGESAVDVQMASAARQRESVEAMKGSLRIQQAALRKQAQLPQLAADTFFVFESAETPGLVPEPSCAALSKFEARGLVERAARTAGVDPNLLQAVAIQESALRPCAVSVKGAQGIMQLMPATAADLGVKNPFDAAESLAGGAALLKQLMQRYSGDLNRVLGAYNAGPGRVDAAGGVPQIPETMNYVDSILGKLP